MVSSRSLSSLYCTFLAVPICIYRTLVAPRYLLKLIAGTAIVCSESDDIASISSCSCGCCVLLLVPVSSLFGFGPMFSMTLWNSLFLSSSSSVYLLLFSIRFHSNLFLFCHNSTSIRFCSARSALDGLYFFHCPCVNL